MRPSSVFKLLLAALSFGSVAQAMHMLPDRLPRAVDDRMRKRLLGLDISAIGPGPAADNTSPTPDNNTSTPTPEPLSPTPSAVNVSPTVPISHVSAQQSTPTPAQPLTSSPPAPSPTIADTSAISPSPSPSPSAPPSPSPSPSAAPASSLSPSPSPSPSPSGHPSPTPLLSPSPSTMLSHLTTPSTPDPSPSPSTISTVSNQTPIILTSIRVVVSTAPNGSPTSYTTISVTTIAPGLTNSSTSDATGLTPQTRNTVIGVVVGVGGAIILGALALVAWRIWRRRRDAYGETDAAIAEYDPARNKVDYNPGSGSTPAQSAARSPFQTTLENYHKPSQVNPSANF